MSSDVPTCPDVLAADKPLRWLGSCVWGLSQMSGTLTSRNPLKPTTWVACTVPRTTPGAQASLHSAIKGTCARQVPCWLCRKGLRPDEKESRKSLRGIPTEPLHARMHASTHKLSSQTKNGSARQACSGTQHEQHQHQTQAKNAREVGVSGHTKQKLYKR